jgi:hypothetical protein
MAFLTSNTTRTFRRACLALTLAAGFAGAVAPAAYGDRGRDRHDRGRDRHDRGHDRRHHHKDRTEFRLDLGIGGRPAPRRETHVEERETRIWVEPEYRTVSEKIWVEPVYETVTDRVWIEPEYRTVVEKKWVPDRYEYREVSVRKGGVNVRLRKKVLARKGCHETVERHVLVREGRWETTERQVLVTAGFWKTIERHELVREGYWETRTERTRVTETDTSECWDESAFFGLTIRD